MLKAKGENTWPTEIPSEDIGEEGGAVEASPSPNTPPREAAQRELNDWDAMMKQTIIKKGDLGCYLIFKYIDDDRSQVSDPLTTMPRFVRR